MKILITGNLGYVGPSVVAELKRSYPSAFLVGLDMDFYPITGASDKNIREIPNEQILADVRDIQPELLSGIDCIVYLAAISNDPMGQITEELTFEINYKAAIRLAQMARRMKTQSFIYASSCSIYGAQDNDALLDENAPTQPLTAYAKSKCMTETGLMKLSDSDFQVTCLRFSTACGMSSNMRLDLFLNDFVAGAMTKSEILLLSNGLSWRPVIHVKDMARAISWAVSRQAGEDFLIVNVGSESCNYQVRDAAHLVTQEIKGSRIRYDAAAGPDPRSYRVSFKRFQELAPHHQPQIGVKEAIRDIYKGLSAAGFLDADYRNSHFIRLNLLKRLIAEGKVLTKPQPVELEN